MAEFMDVNFDPGRVAFGGSGSSPYLPVGSRGGSDFSAGPLQVPKIGPSNVLNPEAVRATGTGPYDAAYRQNLATYAGGQFARPNGNLSFNPTDMSTFPGQPTGGGNAPLPGLPPSLISRALGGNPFSFPQPQQPTQDQKTSGAGNDSVGVGTDWQDWLKRYRNQGRMFGLME